MTSSVRVRVPASTSNLGPGFDCLGLAVNLYNVVTVSRSNQAVRHYGMLGEAADFFFRQAASGKIPPFSFNLKIEGDIPSSRGLGSSVTVRLGLLLGLAELAKEITPLTKKEILDLLITLEGHPDNAVPSFFGGFAVCSPSSSGQKKFDYTRVEVKPELSIITLIPDLKLETKVARELLPKTVPFAHAVENGQRTARIAAAFATGSYEDLRGVFIDHLHQPYRKVLIPGFTEILEAATEAGALGSFLSGAGSTLIALTLDNPEEIGTAMQKTAEDHQLKTQVLFLKADNIGTILLD